MSYSRSWILRLRRMAKIVGSKQMAQFAHAAGLPIHLALQACKGV